MSEAKTYIGSPRSDTTRLRMRGKDVLTEIVGEKTFAEAFYFIVTGRMPEPHQTRVLDAALIILMDHGLTPTALVARLVADSVPDDIQVPMAAGMLMVGNKFVGSMAGAGELLTEGMAHEGDKRAWAAETVREYRAIRKHIPGFGHSYYTPTDPRAERLFGIAEQAGVSGDYIELIRMLGEEVDKAAGRHLTLNVTGALGAVLKEIDFPVEIMRAVAAVGRGAGLAAHIHEEKQKPVVPELTDLANSIEYSEQD